MLNSSFCWWFYLDWSATLVRPCSAEAPEMNLRFEFQLLSCQTLCSFLYVVSGKKATQWEKEVPKAQKVCLSKCHRKPMTISRPSAEKTKRLPFSTGDQLQNTLLRQFRIPGGSFPLNTQRLLQRCPSQKGTNRSWSQGFLCTRMASSPWLCPP